MGIVGLGAIGLELVKIAAPFGFRISAIRRRAGEAEARWRGGGLKPLDRLPDLLACQRRRGARAAARTPETKRLIGKRELDQVKRGALLVNVARGKLVDDAAVIEALPRRPPRRRGPGRLQGQEPLDQRAIRN